MEKYLRGLDDSQKTDEKCGLELSKWLESTANFTPDKKNYIEWESRRFVACRRLVEYLNLITIWM